MTTPATPTVSKRVAKQISDEIRAALGRKEMSRRTLATKLKVDPMWVTRRLSGQTSFTVADVVRIAAILEVDPMTLLDVALGDEVTEEASA